jgi:hypothetical protein
MRTALIFPTILASLVCNAQFQNKIEIVDKRPDHDTVNKIFTQPANQKLTVNYICRVFNFCSSLYEKSSLLDGKDKGNQERRFRNDNLQHIKIKDTLQRLTFDILLSCISCNEETRGYYFEYSKNTDIVYVYKLTDEELINYKNNNIIQIFTNPNRRKTTIKYHSDNSILSVLYEEKGEILFSLKKVN